MNREENTLIRAAADSAASAIQHLVRTFTDDRTPGAISNDLEVAKGRLELALADVKAVIASRTPKF